MILLQTAQPVSPPPDAVTRPDIEVHSRITAQRVVIENRGRVALHLRSSANGREGENNIIEVAAPELPEGQRELNDVEVRVRAEVRIPPPENRPPSQEPVAPE